METERCCQHNRFDDRADLYCHLGDSAHKRIEKHHADAKVVGNGLPDDPPFRHTHDNFDVSCELGVRFRPQARETGRTGFLDFPDRTDELRKLFKFQTAAINFRDLNVHDDGSAVGIHVDQDRRSILPYCIGSRLLLVCYDHLLNCRACWLIRS
jgi:hypothetical protein